MLGNTKKNAAVRLAHGLALGILLSCMMPVTGQDNTRYIIDMVVVTIRQEPNDTSQVLARVTTGDRVAATGLVSGAYEKVALEDGVVGWLDSRYITPKVIARVEVDQLRDGYAELRQLYENAKTAQAQSEESLIRLSDDYRVVNEELNMLRRDAGNPSKSEAMVEQLREQLALSEAQSDQLLRLNKELDESADTRWFLIGAGVLLAGIVLGLLIPKGRRRSSSWDRF